MKDVILFLTSPTTEYKKQISLNNLRQLKKLNKDIIILSTSSLVDQEFYDIATYVIVDENKNIIHKRLYNKQMGYSQPYRSAKSVFHYEIKNDYNLNIVIYQKTNYLNVYKNTKNLISFAIALEYDQFFFVEDDHYFSDTGINQIQTYFNNIKSLNAIYFSNKWCHNIIRSHFWFGNCRYFQESILNKFPEDIDEIDSNYPYFSYYELFLYTQMYHTTHNKNGVIFESFDDKPFDLLFGNDSQLNQNCTEECLNSDLRCNIVYDYRYSQPTFLFVNNNTQSHIVVYKNNVVYIDELIKQGNNQWIIKPISIDGEIKVELNDSIIKTFNLTSEEVLLNGYIK